MSNKNLLASDEMLLETIDLDPSALADDLLSFDGVGDGTQDINPFGDLEGDGFGDLDDAMLGSGESDEIETPISVQVEDTFLGLIARQQEGKILELTNLELPSSLDDDTRSQFSGLYYKALSEMPSLALYPKLVQAGVKLSQDEEEGTLCIQFPNNQSAMSFTDSVGSLLTGDSMVVEALTELRTQAIDAANKLAQSNPFNVSKRTHGEGDGMNVSDLDFSEHQLSDNLALGVDDNSIFGGEQVVDQQPIEISLIDYSNKAIAEYLIEHNKEADDAKITEALQAEGFPRQRISEILGIFKYLRTNSTIAGKLGINRTAQTSDLENFNWNA